MWAHLSVLGGRVDEESVERLVARLSALDEDEILAFSDELALALWRLDTEAHFRQPVHDVEDPPGAAPLPMSSDAFLYLRCAVVGAGRERYEQALTDPAALAGEWDCADGELLLTVAPRAYETVSDYAWDHESPVSVETGSNHAGWPGAGTAAVSSAFPAGPVRAARWLYLGTGWDGVDLGSPFRYWQDQAADRLDGDREWRAWFESLGVEEVWLFPLYTTGSSGKRS